MNFKKIDKKTYLYLGIGFGIMLLIIIVILILNILAGGKVSFSVAEQKMQNAAVKYFEVRKEKLPAVNEETKVDMEELVNAKLIKSFDKLLKEESTCNGYVTVKNNNGLYLYSPYLDCGKDYKSKKLHEQIKLDNFITTSGDGLYSINNELVFRGEFVNNYISFADKLWRIIKINSDNSLRIIEVDRENYYTWDNRYNINVNSSTGINDYRVSRIKDTIEKIYNNKEEFDDIDKSFITKQNVCLGKQTEDSAIVNGSIECSDILENQYVSLLQVNEYVLSSIDKNCKKLSDQQCSNYNYMANFDNTFWTITGDANRSNYVFKISSSPDTSIAISSYAINLVIHIDDDAIYDSGNGTLENPYTIKMTK